MPYDVLAVELSSFQLHYTDSMSAEAAAVLNVAEDHLDWYAADSSMADYAADKARAYERVQRACVYNVEDPLTEQLVREADVIEGARAVGSPSACPPSACSASSTTSWPTAPSSRTARRAPPNCARWPTPPTRAAACSAHRANALAAAALARAHGVSQAAVRDGLRSSAPRATGSRWLPRTRDHLGR